MREFGKILVEDYESLDAFLRAVFTDRLDWVRKHRLILRVALQETPLHPELKSMWNESVIDELRPRVLAVIERFQEQGLILDVPSERVARTAASVLLGYAIQRFFVEPDREWNDEDELETMVTILKRGLSPS